MTTANKNNQQVIEAIELPLLLEAMFRDPAFCQVLREKVVPELRSLPFIRIWHAALNHG